MTSVHGVDYNQCLCPPKAELKTKTNPNGHHFCGRLGLFWFSTRFNRKILDYSNGTYLYHILAREKFAQEHYNQILLSCNDTSWRWRLDPREGKRSQNRPGLGDFENWRGNSPTCS